MFNYAESLASRNTYMTSIRETIADSQRTKPLITISINGVPEVSKSQKVYTTSDRIEGQVSIVAPADTRFDDICITFEGTSRTWMERFGGTSTTSGRTTVAQTFLRLVQPVDETTLPIPRIAVKGKTYMFPFTFVIPQNLLPSACTHITENQAVMDAHLHLPPSIGDPAVLTEDKDDLAPDMTRISYAIRVRVVRARETEYKKVIIADTSLRVAVSPECPDAPPVHIETNSKDFVLQKEKDLRKGLLGRKIGRFSVLAEQPKPLRLVPNSPCPPSTTVPVFLAFMPTDPEIPPPELGTLSAKLRTNTFFSTTKMTYIPTPARATPDPTVGNYTESTLLSSRCISNVKWERDYPSSKPRYTAQAIVPVTAPKCKQLVPSFSSCFLSRSYILDLSLSVRTSNHSQPSLALKIPLQVSQPPLQAIAQSQAADSGVEEFFTPRVIAPSTLLQEIAMMPPSEPQGGEPQPPPPPPQQTGQVSQLPQSMMVRPPNRMPPSGYAVFGNSGGVPVRIPDPIGISPGCG